MNTRRTGRAVRARILTVIRPMSVAVMAAGFSGCAHAQLTKQVTTQISARDSSAAMRALATTLLADLPAGRQWVAAVYDPARSGATRAAPLSRLTDSLAVHLQVKRGSAVGHVPSPDGTEAGRLRSQRAAAAYVVLWGIDSASVRPDTMGVHGRTTYHHTQPECGWSSKDVDYVIVRSGTEWRVANATTTVTSDGPCEP